MNKDQNFTQAEMDEIISSSPRANKTLATKFNTTSGSIAAMRMYLQKQRKNGAPKVSKLAAAPVSPLRVQRHKEMPTPADVLEHVKEHSIIIHSKFGIIVVDKKELSGIEVGDNGSITVF